MQTTRTKVKEYISNWKKQGYADGIPDEVPAPLMQRNLAPSYKAIAQAILSNDLHMESLGFAAPSSEWYSVLKKIEISERQQTGKQEGTKKMENGLGTRINELRDDGKTWQQVAEILNSEKFKTAKGKKFTIGTVLHYYNKKMPSKDIDADDNPKAPRRKRLVLTQKNDHASLSVNSMGGDVVVLSQENEILMMKNKLLLQKLSECVIKIIDLEIKLEMMQVENV